MADLKLIRVYLDSEPADWGNVTAYEARKCSELLARRLEERFPLVEPHIRLRAVEADPIDYSVRTCEQRADAERLGREVTDWIARHHGEIRREAVGEFELERVPPGNLRSPELRRAVDWEPGTSWECYHVHVTGGESLELGEQKELDLAYSDAEHRAAIQEDAGLVWTHAERPDEAVSRYLHGDLVHGSERQREEL